MDWVACLGALAVVAACGPSEGAATGSGESSSGGDTTEAPGGDDDPGDDSESDGTSDSVDETGGSTTTGSADSTGSESSDTTGDPVEVPELEFVVLVRPVNQPAYLERYVMLDGEFGEPVPASEPIFGSTQLIRARPVSDRRQMIYQTQGAVDDDVFLADYSDPEASVYQQLDVEPGAIPQISATDVDIVPSAPAVTYNDTTQHFAVQLEQGGASSPILVYEEPTPQSSALYAREPTSSLGFLGINDGDNGELWLSDLAADPSALIPVGAPTTPWQNFSGSGVLPDDAGVLYRSDVVADDIWDVYVAPLEDGSVGPAQALSNVVAPAYVSWAETHPYSGGVLYTWQAGTEPFGGSEYYWVPMDGAEPGAAIALNNDGMGRIGSRVSSGSGRILAFEGAPLADGTPQSYRFVDFESGTPSAPVPLDISSSGQVTFHNNDRWLYYYDGPPFDLYRADLAAEPVEHQFIAEGVASWGRMSPDGTILCLDDDLDDGLEDIERFRLVDVSGDTIGESTVIEVDVPSDRWARFCSISADGKYLFYNEASAFVDRALVVLDLAAPDVELLRIEAEFVDGPWHLPAAE
ncbi:MAG: hypothetical protein AAF721_00880 [Myxococcota bacterium]